MTILERIQRSAVASFAAALAAFTAAAAEPDASAYPLMGWYGAPHTTEGVYRYRDVGFSIMPIFDVEAQLGIARSASERNMAAYIRVPNGADARAYTAYARHVPQVTGWLVGTRITPDGLDGVRARNEGLDAMKAGGARLASLAPGPSPAAWRAAADALEASGLTTVVFEQFFFGADGGFDEDGLHAQLELGRWMRRETGLEVWGMVQVVAHDAYRRTAESEIRMQSYAHLAYDAEGLAYFASGEPPEDDWHGRWGGAMLDSGQRRAHYGYEMAWYLNREILRMAEQLQGLEFVDTYYVGAAPDSARRLPAAGLPVRRVEGERGLIGHYRDGEGAAWMLLVNRRQGMLRSAKTTKSTFRIFVEDGVEAASEIDRHNGFAKPIALDDGAFLITIPGGTGALIRLGPPPDAE